jgi:putative transposase
VDLGARMDALRFVIRDRDSKYALAFDSVFDAEVTQAITTPPRAPRADAICERVVGTLRSELLDRILILGPGRLHVGTRTAYTHVDKLGMKACNQWYCTALW